MRIFNKKIVSITMSTLLAVGGVFANVQTGYGNVGAGSIGTNENISKDVDVNDLLSQNDKIINISSAEDFINFAKLCRDDSYSRGKTFVLTEDINLSGMGFEGVPYFAGVFNGNNHTISGINISIEGSNLGTFRYVSSQGAVVRLNIIAHINPQGTENYVGGMAGTNSGIIYSCTVNGTVSGKQYVGGVAGENKNGGQIVGCKSESKVTATQYTGGIVGTNSGTISQCTNNGKVNNDEYKTTFDLGGVDVGTFNITQNVMNRSDMGGICGYSTGVISECVNNGIIGYDHSGYNVGGIVGRQKGTVSKSVNYGQIYGRKDVGGIVGQAEPYIETEYLSDVTSDMSNDVNDLIDTVNNMTTTIDNTSDSMNNYMNSLNDEYNKLSNSLTDNMKIINNSINTDDEKTKQYVDNINKAMDNIANINKDNKDDKDYHHKFTDDQLDKISDNLQIISDNLKDLYNSIDTSEEDVSQAVDNITNDLEDSSKQVNQDFKDINKTLNDSVNSLTASMNKATDQMGNLADTTKDTVNDLTSTSQIEDISSKDTLALQGVIWQCTNRGEINADINVAGIAGCMNIEYEADMETDLDFSDRTSIAVRQKVNCIIAQGVNYGVVTVKKNSAGGVAGLQELGYIYRSEDYGKITGEEGEYLGGIVGKSISTVEESYSFAIIDGVRYIGGIAGQGYKLINCISLSDIAGTGEGLGAIAGKIDDAGEISGNYYANSKYGAIDNINYVNAAWHMSYEEIMKRPNVPAGFKTVTIRFLADGNELSTKNIPYNSNLSEEDIPSCPEKDGYYWKWPDSFDRIAIKESIDVEAEYVPWTESISYTRRDDKTPYVIAEGEFYANDTLDIIELRAAKIDIDKDAVYGFDWSIGSENSKEYKEVKLHVRAVKGASTIYYYENNKWVKAETATDGSYVVCSVPYGAKVALVMDETNYQYIIIIAAAVLVAVIIVIVVLRKKKKSKKNKE